MTLYRRLIEVLWFLLLVSIPVTSFPLLAERMGNVTVAPMALIPLALLVLLWLLPELLGGRSLPFAVWPLLGFCLVALLSAGVGWFLPLPSIKGQTVLSREIRALSTLGVGISFYFLAVGQARDSGGLRITRLGIYLGGILLLIWSTVQADYILEGLNNVPQELNEFHRLFSIRDLERNRVTGFAFEPSWLGDQLIVLYLPIWLGAVLTKDSILPFHKGPVSLEFALSLWGGWILLMTRSRVSILALLSILGGLMAYGLWRWAGRISAWILGRIDGMRGSNSLAILLKAVMLVAAAGILLGVGYGLLVRGAEVDWRMRRALSLRTELPGIREQHPFEASYEIADRLAVAERLVYWRASIEPFQRYPALGVGPGNAGFLFAEGVPAYGYRLVEIRSFLNPESPNFPNPKNLWIRLLSETGILGFAFYLSWMLVLAILAWGLWKKGGKLGAWIGVAGCLALAAQGIEGFSLDTFALPQVWIINGILTAVARRAA